MISWKRVLICLLTLLTVSCGFEPTSQLDDSSGSSEEVDVGKNVGGEAREELDMLNEEQVISAEVLLISASGAAIDGDTIITSENVAEFLPGLETVTTVNQYFKKQGFEVSSSGGISTSITGTAEQFSELFDAAFTVSESGGIQAVLNSGERSELLQLDTLPPEIRDLVVAVTLVPPPDFGPMEFGP